MFVWLCIPHTVRTLSVSVLFSGTKVKESLHQSHASSVLVLVLSHQMAEHGHNEKERPLEPKRWRVKGTRSDLPSSLWRRRRRLSLFRHVFGFEKRNKRMLYVLKFSMNFQRELKNTQRKDL